MGWRNSAKTVRPVRRQKLFIEPLEDRRLLSAGALDPTFGSGGKILTSIGGTDDEATANVLQADGKIVVAGFATTATGQDFALARYNANGALDNSFGNSGIVTTDFFGADDEALGVVEMPDGRIVAAGFATNAGGHREFAVARYLANGNLDPNFGSGGKLVTSIFGNSDQGQAVQLQTDGSIVVAGSATIVPFGSAFALTRYNVNGNLDAGFGTNGIVTTTFAFQSVDAAHALLIQPNGKIVAAGSSNQGNGNVFGVARYNTDGSLDALFGSGGKVSTSVAGQQDDANSVTIQSDGKLVVAGDTKVGGFLDFAVARFTKDGTLDSSFGSGGLVKTDFAGKDDRALSVVVQADGKIVAAGSVTLNGNVDMGMVRYSVTGVVDGTFGTTGTVVTDFGGGLTVINSLSLGKDGSFLAAGAAATGVAREFALVRYVGDTFQVGQLDANFGVGGKVIFQFDTTKPDAEAMHDMVVQPDGRIVAVGSVSAFSRNSGSQFGVVRFNNDGSVDTTFGNNGAAVAGFGAVNLGDARGVALQADGKIVVVGSYANGAHLALARFNSDGTLDQSFGVNGKVAASLFSAEVGYTVAVDPDGKIVVGGSAEQISGAPTTYFVARFNADGSVDGSFGLGGDVTTTLTFSGSSILSRLILQPDRKIVAVGITSIAGGSFHYAVVRYNANGGLDLNFGAKGVVLLDIPQANPLFNQQESRGLTLEPDGKILVVGDYFSSNSTTAAVIVRLNTDGSLDPTFNATGIASFADANGAVAYEVAVQANGKILVAGTDGNGAAIADLAPPTSGVFYLERFNPNGVPDPTFGTNGVVTTTLTNSPLGESIKRVVVLSNGEILAGGPIFSNAVGSFGLAQYLGDQTGPVASGGGVYVVAEGGRVQLDGSASHSLTPSGAPLTYAWDLNGDGIYGQTGATATRGDETGVTPVFIAVGLDAPITYKVRLRVTDKQGLTNYTDATVLITEAAPTVSISDAGAVNEGATYTLNLSAVDPGPDPFTKWTINWGDGTIQTTAGNVTSVTHTFRTESAGNTVSATVTNADGTFAAGNTVSVVVSPVAPTVVIGGNSAADQGELYMLNLSAVEPGNDTIISWQITWGDGVVDTIAGSATSATHIYGAVTQSFTVSATATDEDSTYNSNQITVAVSNLPLVLTLVGPNFVLPGTVYTLNPTSSKPLTNTITSWTINWGDGKVQTFAGSPSSVTHTYASLSSTYLISGSAADATGTHAANNTITLDSRYPTHNQSFVAQLYVDLLNRPVDPVGLASWSGVLNIGGDRQRVIDGIEHSPEYIMRQIENAYSKLLGRQADTGGLLGFLSFMFYGGTIEQVKATIMGSTEYFTRAGSTNDGFLHAVYLDALGRPIDADGEINWQHRLDGGLSRQQVADAILRSQEADILIVENLYQQLLHRQADQPGLESWVNALLNGLSAERITSLISASAEYFARSQ